MEQITFTPAQLVAKVREAAEANPDFVYDKHAGEPADDYVTCRYFNKDETPSCIVGHGLAALGITLDQLDLVGANTVGVDGLFDDLGLPGGCNSPVESFEFSWLDRVQSKQDCGMSWGEAIREADEELS